MTREVICYVTNQTSSTYYNDGSLTNVWNGEDNKGGTNPQPINVNTNKQQLFYYHKTTGSDVGVTGKVVYDMGDDIKLQLSFNNPYDQISSPPGGGDFCLCFFYAGLTGVKPDSLPDFTIMCQVDTDGAAWDPSSTAEVNTITAYITIISLPIT